MPLRETVLAPQKITHIGNKLFSLLYNTNKFSLKIKVLSGMKNLKVVAIVLSLFTFIGCGDTANENVLEENPVDEEITSEGDEEYNQLAETATATIVDTPSLNSFAELLQETDLADMLAETEGGPYTVFAPTDAAFNSLQPVTLEWLLMDENMDRLTDLLGYHIVVDEIAADEIAEDGQMFETAYENEVKIQITDDGKWLVDGVEVIDVMQASNGHIYVIGEVLIPDDWANAGEWDEVDY